MRRPIRVAVSTAAALATTTLVLATGGYLETLAQTVNFLAQFNGSPPVPTHFDPADWDISVLTGVSQTIDPMEAQHGPDCSAPPATHHITSIAETVFQCNDHIMTAISAGYGAVYLSPNHLVDFSNGEAVVKFDMSTLRTSGRDWVDLIITPFDDNLQLSFDVQDSTPPRNGVRFEMLGELQGIFQGSVIRNFNSTPIASSRQTYTSVLVPSAVRRDTFEAHISRTHLKFGMPAYNLWWVDTNISDLGWTQGVVQINHRSYNPTKACDFDGTCGPDTWHWNNIGISPAVPFAIIRGNRRLVERANPQLSFPAPSPQNARLRFAAIGSNLSFSVDGGASWTSARFQGQEVQQKEHFQSYWTPIPAGVTSVLFRGDRWFSGDWQVQDVAIWASGAAQPILDPTVTPTATRTPTSSPTPTLTPTRVPDPPTATAVPQQPASDSTSSTRSSSNSAPRPAPSTGGGGGRGGGGGGGRGGGGGGGAGGGGGGGGGAAPAPPPVFVNPAPTATPTQVVDQTLALLSLPQTNGPRVNWGTVDVSPLQRDQLPAPPPDFDFGETAISVTDNDPTASGMVVPLTWAHQPTAAELERAQGDLRRIWVAYWDSSAWLALQCSTDAPSSSLSCRVPRIDSAVVLISPPAQEPLDYDLTYDVTSGVTSGVTNGHFYKQTNGFGGAGESGFAVVDDQNAALWTEFQRMGGVAVLGHPVSQRFEHEGFLMQTFQKAALQWWPDLGLAVAANILDDLSQQGADAWLDTVEQVPTATDANQDAGLPWDQLVTSRVGLLDSYPALQNFYLTSPNSLALYGLPLSVKTYGPLVVVRLQRVTLQMWQADQPWAPAGTVVVGNAGDLAKEAGLVPRDALTPRPLSDDQVALQP